MLKFHRNISLERLEKFVSTTHFNDVNLQSALYKRRDSGAVKLQVFGVPDLKRMQVLDPLCFLLIRG